MFRMVSDVEHILDACECCWITYVDVVNVHMCLDRIQF
jgi:hypothetical protein